MPEDVFPQLQGRRQPMIRPVQFFFIFFCAGTMWNKNHGVVGNLVEASEDGDQVDRMVVPSQAEVLRGRPT